ncbi:AT-rich interactive domain-containing protein 3 [Zea mays]|uniref:AT-rich interactive domain-containing protein 3 n=1 Tax=Zea mays TaxID=4577 RepID=A0A1D6LR72_MAIZE|nr:AT-rich interactive domain-containing protein 3 [Zea mays]
MSQQQGVEEPPPAPLPAAEGEAQPAADIPMSEAAEVEDEEEEPVVGEGEDGADGAADAVDSVNASAKPEAEGAEEEGGSDRKERNGGPTADLVGEVVKLENGDGPVTVGGSVDEGRGGDGGDDKGLAGQNQPAVNQLLLAPAEEDLALSKISDNSFMFDYTTGGDDSGTEEEQAAFMKELERFHREKMLEFKPPKFYGEGLNCLKLWRQVTGLGGYDQVTSCKLWRQVGESFKPPKTCTTVSWTFRNFYEKALLEYEKHKIETGEFQVASSALPDRFGSESQVGGSHVSGSGRARRESATRAMQGWHSQRLLGNGEIADPIIKDKGHIVLKKDKTPKSSEDQNDSMVIDMGPPADWVKINVRKTKDCYEVYALVPGLLREEVHVQSDPAGRLIVTGEPEQLDNPWGVTPFKKVISLPSRIDPHQTSAVVTLHGQLFVRAPFEQSK